MTNEDEIDLNSVLNIVLPFLSAKEILVIKELAEKFRHFISFNDLSKYINILLEKHYNFDKKDLENISKEFEKIHNKTVNKKPTIRNSIISTEFKIPDKRSIEFSKNLTNFYFGKYFSEDKNNQKQVLNWLNKYYLEQGNPIGKDKKGIDEFINNFQGFLKNNSRKKARQIIDTSITYIKNSAKIKQMYEIVENYRWDAINDRISCTICRSMDGRIFSVKKAYNLIEKIENSEDPKVIKDLRPFLNKKQIGKSDNILNKMPPIHPLCGCKIVASFDETLKKDTKVETPKGVIRTDLQNDLENEFKNLTNQERFNKIQSNLSATWFTKKKGGEYDFEKEHLIKDHYEKHKNNFIPPKKTLEEYTKGSFNVIKNYSSVYVQREIDDKKRVKDKYLFQKGNDLVIISDENLVITSYYPINESYLEKFVKGDKNGSAGLIRLL